MAQNYNDSRRYRDERDSEHGWRDEDRSFRSGRGETSSEFDYGRGREGGRSDYGRFGTSDRDSRGDDFGRSRGYQSGSHSSYGQRDDGRESVERSRFGREERRSSPTYGGAYDSGYGAGESRFGRDRSYADYGSDRSYGDDRRDYRSRSGSGEERSFWDRATDEVSSWFGDDDAERRRDADRHRGRGPKNYTRSDDRIREDVSERLTDDWRVDASEIEVAVSSGEVTLTGSVESRDQRRRAEDVAEAVSGVRHVQNNIRVHGSGHGAATTTGSAGTANHGTLATSGGSAATGASLAGSSSYTSNTGPGTQRS